MRKSYRSSPTWSGKEIKPTRDFPGPAAVIKVRLADESTIPASTLADVGGKLTTRLTKREVYDLSEPTAG